MWYALRVRWPLLDLIRSVRRDGFDAATIGLCSAMGLLALGTLGAALMPQAWLARSHQPGSVVWALTQPIPFMYTLENRWRAEPESEPEPGFEAGCPTSGIRQHAPVGALTSPVLRWRFRFCGLPSTVTLTSTLRGHQVRSRWRVRRSDTDEQVLLIEPAAP